MQTGCSARQICSVRAGTVTEIAIRVTIKMGIKTVARAVVKTAITMPARIIFLKIHVLHSSRYAICAAVCLARRDQGESGGPRGALVNAERLVRRDQGESRDLRDVLVNAESQARRVSQARKVRRVSQARRDQGVNQVHVVRKALRVMRKTV